MNLSIKISRSQFIESSFGDKKQDANIIRWEGDKCNPAKDGNVLKLDIKVWGPSGARLTCSRRRSTGMVCRALIFSDFSTYWERVALKSDLAASERDRRTRRWSIAVISCETSAPLLRTHVNPASWWTWKGLQCSTSKKKRTFPSYRSAEVMLGDSVWIIPVRSALRRIKSSQTSQRTWVNRNNPLV